MTPNTPSRLRRWLSWTPLLAAGLAGLIGYRAWTDTLEQSPAAEVHSAFLNFMAERSPNARDYRNRYYKAFGRDSVASKHFEQVCAAMVRAAIDDGVDPAKHSAPMAAGCKSFGRKYPPGALPQKGPR